MEIEKHLLLLITLNIGLLITFSWLGFRLFRSYIVSTKNIQLWDNTFAQLTLNFKIPRIMKRYIIRCKRIIDNSDGEEPPLGSLFVM